LVAFGHFKIEVFFFPFFPCLHFQQLDLEFFTIGHEREREESWLKLGQTLKDFLF
jgi:hypothetical protein